MPAASTLTSHFVLGVTLTVGLAHLGSVSTSVMATPHGYRCHDILTKTLQEDELDDINGLY